MSFGFGAYLFQIIRQSTVLASLAVRDWLDSAVDPPTRVVPRVFMDSCIVTLQES